MDRDYQDSPASCELDLTCITHPHHQSQIAGHKIQTQIHKTHTTHHTPQSTNPQAAHFLIFPRDHHTHDSRETGSNPDGGF